LDPLQKRAVRAKKSGDLAVPTDDVGGPSCLTENAARAAWGGVEVYACLTQRSELALAREGVSCAVPDPGLDQ
jgi:hypothetical protein